MKRLTFLVGLLTYSAVHAQNVTIKKVEIAGEKILVYYDLEDNNPKNEYQLNLFSSRDNFSSPLSKVKGDVGMEITPASGRRIEWNVREEYGSFKGKIALEIRGRVIMSFVRLQNFGQHESYKRGKQYNLNWKPGNASPIHIEMYKGSQRLNGEMNHPNSGEYTLNIPANAKLGGDYRLKITDSKNTESVIYTPYFRVRAKVPLLVKVLPVLAIGGVAAALSGGGETIITTGSNKLPDPPTQN